MNKLKCRKKVAPPIRCEDCGEDIPKGQRRRRCPKCKKLVCGWCYNHVHGGL